jgi:hypothetical protein
MPTPHLRATTVASLLAHLGAAGHALRGAYMIMATPTRQIAAPARS